MKFIEDITKIDKISEYISNDKIEDGIDGVIGGPSCFTGDTLVLTSRGYIPIKEVQIGDKVISHDNKYHKVTNVINQGYKNVVNLRGYAFSGNRTCQPRSGGRVGAYKKTKNLYGIAQG